MTSNLENWKHFNPVRIVQGPGILTCISKWVPSGTILLVTTEGFTRRGITQQLRQTLSGPVIVYDRVKPNPDIDDIEEAVDSLRKHKATAVIALGGGSVIDTGKAFAVALTCERSTFLSDVLRHGKNELPDACLPLVAVPTTAGTGAEVTPFATIWDHRNRCKLSLDGEQLFPIVAILDPTLHVSLPKKETLYSGLDCVSHAMETLWNRNRTPVSEALSFRALTDAVVAFPQVLTDPTNLVTRSKMQVASTLAGIAISQNRTALAHSISYPLTSHFSVPHGLAASFTIVAIIRLMREYGYFCGTVEIDILVERVEEMLQSFNLKTEILRYVSLQQAKEKITEMFTPRRVDNFIAVVKPEMIKTILKDSFS